MPPRYPQASRLLASAALAAVLALSLGACKTMDTTGSIGGEASAPRSEAQWREEVDRWAARYRSNPGDPEVAMAYAQALRATAQRAQGAAVLEQATIQNPQNRVLLGAYGRALADVGSYTQALDVLGRAHTPDQPDWRILSAQGAVLDQMGRHQEAQRHYASALKMAPEDPSILSNLGLSYALSKDLKRAEATLRRAVAQSSADSKARQNLALVVGLQGRFPEAESIARSDLPPDEAAANVAFLRQMLSEENERKRKAGAVNPRRKPTPDA